MKTFVSFVIKETKHIVRDRRTMLILFGMPTLLMLLFGFALTTDVKNVRTAIVCSEMNHSTEQAIDRLSRSQYFIITATTHTPEEAMRLIKAQKADIALVFGKNFTKDKTDMQIIVDGTDPNMSLQWNTYAQQVILNPTSTGVNIKMLYNPQMQSAYNFVPAIMGMLLMLVCAMMTSVSIVREKEKGTMEVLLVSPIRPLMIIVAKTIPYMILAVVILVIILLMTRFVLGVPLAGSITWIVLTSILYILLALSLGLLISNIAKSQMMALLLSAMVLLMPIVMLSGMIYPIESMPAILQYVSAIVPPRYYISAMRKLMIMGVGLQGIAKELVILLSMTALILAVALAKFKTRLE